MQKFKNLFKRYKINTPISKIVKAAKVYEPYYIKDFFFLEYTGILNCCKGIESVFAYEFVRHHKKKRHIKEFASKNQVISFLESLPDFNDEEIEKLFGSDWVHVYNFLQRYIKLTEAEVDKLLVNHNYFLNSVPNIPECKYLAYLWDPCIIQFKQIDKKTFAFGIWKSSSEKYRKALNIVWALIYRDQIGKSSFTQEQYDIMTESWRKNIGQLHPKDKKLK